MPEDDTAKAAGSPGDGGRFRAGDRLGGNYRLVRLLGSGGMGDVWLSHNEALDVEVAIKLLRSASGESGEKEAAERLLTEARAAARLGHPAIVRVFDFGRTESGDPYIVMERLIGEDLATALGRLHRLSPVKAARTLLPIAHALSAAHAKGIIHRDLKPENVFLAQVEGDRLQPKIVDFGIAQVDRAKALGRSGAYALLGSPAYMAPEQARGEDSDPRADVWSFTVVLYECVAGQKPFSGDSADAMIRAIVSDEPAPLPEIPGMDDAFAALLRKGLEKSPSNRFESIRELGEALSAWLLARGVNEDISGALLDATWGSRPSEDPVGTAVPLPRVAEKHAIATVIRPGGSAPHAPPSPLLLTIAVLAAIAGIGIGVLVGLHGRRGSKASPPASAVPVRALSHLPLAPIPVEPLEQIPIDETEHALPPSDPKPGSREGAPRGVRPSPFGRKPRRSLKDPFQ